MYIISIKKNLSTNKMVKPIFGQTNKLFLYIEATKPKDNKQTKITILQRNM